MTMFVQSGGHGGGRRRSRRQMSEINVTPMVDVMLVLLVIFMVTAPLLTTGVNVDLPQAQTKALSQPDNKALTVSVSKDGTVYIQETPVEIANLGARLIAITKANPEALIYVRGDMGINYGKVMEVLGVINSAGFSKAALVTRPAAGK